MKINRIIGILSCCFAAVACGSSDGANGLPGADGADGAQGAPGADGQAGSAGSGGATGAAGDKGETGATGAQGPIGDIACGDDLITAAEWHTACGSSVGSCKQGQVQCRLYENDGELLAHKVCYGEVKPAANSGKCYLDDDCDGVKDNTDGAGDNVTFVKQAWQYEAKISGSSTSLDITLSEGRCRNAKKHCLGPDASGCFVDANGEGVTFDDFVADAKESDLGYECTDGQDIRTWECTVGQDGIARVTCTGPRGL